VSTLVDFLGAFFPNEDEKIHLRAFKAKGARDAPDNHALVEVATRRSLATDANLQTRITTANKTRGWYFVVNAGGNTDKDISRFNAFFCECDDLPLTEQHVLLDRAPVPTSIRVETLKSVHAYWLRGGDCSEHQWREVQARLIAFFNSDTTIKNPSRVMRLPFSNYVFVNDESYEYKRVELIQFNLERRYSVNRMLEAFPPVGAGAQAKAYSSECTHTNTGFSNWAALKAELGRRIVAHATARQNNQGKWDCRGVCHNGNGDSGLFYDPKTNATHCNKDCDEATILRAFGLPDRPNGSNGKHNHDDSENQQQTEKAKTIKLRCLADVKPESVDFLWYPYIPKAKLTLIEGDPGVGKSWLTCALAAATAAGKGPSNWMQAEPANVLLLSVEDGLSDTIRPRLDAMQADVKRIFALEGALVFNDAGLLRLEAEIIEVKPALVVIDPLVAYLGAGVDIHRANETRAITARLAMIAEKYGCAVVAVRHLTKGGKDRAIYRGIGSIDFTASCRSSLLVGCDPEDQSQRAIIHIKSNLAEVGSAVGYEIREGRFFWTGSSRLTEDQILSASSGSSEQTSLQEAEEFLKQALADGERKADEIKKEARSIGISDWQLRKARSKLGIKPRKMGRPGEKQHWSWELPTQPEDESLSEDETEDVKKKENSHLRTNRSDKEFKASHLAEDESELSFTHLRGGEASINSEFVTCLIDGSSGLRFTYCDRCGEFLR
jgi:hypothetical protein